MPATAHCPFWSAGHQGNVTPTNDLRPPSDSRRSGGARPGNRAFYSTRWDEAITNELKFPTPSVSLKVVIGRDHLNVAIGATLPAAAALDNRGCRGSMCMVRVSLVTVSGYRFFRGRQVAPHDCGVGDGSDHGERRAAPRAAASLGRPCDRPRHIRICARHHRGLGSPTYGRDRMGSARTCRRDCRCGRDAAYRGTFDARKSRHAPTVLLSSDTAKLLRRRGFEAGHSLARGAISAERWP